MRLRPSPTQHSVYIGSHCINLLIGCVKFRSRMYQVTLKPFYLPITNFQIQAIYYLAVQVYIMQRLLFGRMEKMT